MTEQGQNADTLWFLCCSCGAAAAYYPTKCGEIPAGAVAHSKPLALEGIPNTVPCALYRRSTPAQFWEANKNSRRVARPVDMSPSQKRSTP